MDMKGKLIPRSRVAELSLTIWPPSHFIKIWTILQMLIFTLLQAKGNEESWITLEIISSLIV